MTDLRTKLHPSSCFPPNPSVHTTQNRLFIRIASNQRRTDCPRLTFIGINATTYSTIAALLAYRPSPSIESIKLLDLCEKSEPRTMLHDLQLIALFNQANIHLQWAQSYWETKDSNVIIINVQHHQLENESISTWTQMNASLVEDIVFQVCIHSPYATLIICTQPNELMTYVAWRVSRFPSERVIGLGASIETAYAHKTILDHTGNIHGRVNGFFVLGHGSIDDSCTTVFTDHLTIDGIRCSDIYLKSTSSCIQNKMSEDQYKSERRKFQDWNLINILQADGNLYSDVSRRLPITANLLSRQKIVVKYFSSNSSTSRSEPTEQRSIEFSLPTKPRSNWTEAMLLVHLIRALINNSEFQSNFAVNIASVNNSTDIFINYPSIIGSGISAIKHMLPFLQAQKILEQRSSLVPFVRSQTKLCLFKSKD